MNPMIIDIETAPLDYEKFLSLADELRLDLLNPIDSRIIAIGIKYKGDHLILMDPDERKILIKFWLKWKEIQQKEKKFRVVGFNITQFDIPFITSRSFIHKVPIVPFILKDIIDVRDKINAYRYGKTRGKLKEYAQLIGIDIMDIDGSDIGRLWYEEEFDVIEKYLIHDLDITAQLFKRLVETNIFRIEKW
jgi:uncharacterized protein